MELKLYNTLTKTKEVFQPIDPKNVRMYVCGPTVYDYAHIGNARPAIVFDVLFRLLRHVYGESHVTYVRNITDVDDKINARAAEEYPQLPLNEAIRQVTEKTNAQYQADVAALGCLPPTHQPRATENIAEMIAMIRQLIAAGHAYPAEGHVLYDVSSKPDYGKLARRSLDEMIAGSRVEVAPYKKSPMDFVLWKPSPPELPGWESPWGRGRPGWHIECSAMSERLLGQTFDIHGGGIDLVFPHHENEIAQSEGAHRNAPLARIWMHNGFLQVEGEKMSKSLGNFVTINDLLSRTDHVPRAGDAIRLAMLTTHYRQPIDWTQTKLLEAGNNLYTFFHVITKGLGLSQKATAAGRQLPEPSQQLVEYLADDLNTPSAVFSHLFGLVKQADRVGGIRELPAAQLFSDCLLLGIDPLRYVHVQYPESLTQIEGGQVRRLIDARNAARKAKDFKEADRIRGELDAMGVALKDSKDPKTGEIVTTWELKR